MRILVTIICYFAVLLLIARLTGKGKKSSSDAAFFRGENRSPWYIVSFGMIGASISGVTFVSVPGMVRSMDMTYMQTVFGFFFGYLVVAHVLLPMYYRLNLTSIYSYLGTRIGVQTYRTGAFFFCFRECSVRLPNSIWFALFSTRMYSGIWAYLSGLLLPVRWRWYGFIHTRVVSKPLSGQTRCRHSA